MDAAAQNIILLQSSDGIIFRVKEAAAVQLEALRDRVEAIEGNYADDIIPVPNVNSQILAKVIEYCERHVDAADDEDLRAFDAEFVRVDQSTLFDIILAANYLDIRSLLDLTCQTVVDVIKGKTPEEIRKTFNIKNEFTQEEEEEEVRRENAWAFE